MAEVYLPRLLQHYSHIHESTSSNTLVSDKRQLPTHLLVLHENFIIFRELGQLVSSIYNSNSNLPNFLLSSSVFSSLLIFFSCRISSHVEFLVNADFLVIAPNVVYTGFISPSTSKRPVQREIVNEL